MIDKDAITALQEGASIHQADNNVKSAAERKEASVTALPDHFTLHDLEKFLPNRRRARGTMSTPVLESFAAYTKEHSEEGAAVFINVEHFTARAVLNLGTPTAPGHADHQAVLQPKRTAAYTALRSIATGSGHKQTVIAEFLEDWAGHIQCFNDAGEISAPKAIAAVRKITIEAMRKLESTEQQLSEQRSAFESVQATSTEPLPTTIYFKCHPYPDIAERLFVLRLGVLTGSDKPTINLRIVKMEQHEEEMAQELAEAIEGTCLSELPVHIGTYSASN